MTLTAIDVCGGCGGLSLGLKKAGFNVLAAYDIDPIAVETYNANRKYHKGASHVADLRTLSKQQVLSTIPTKTRINLVAGCPPCQGFSRIRTRNGGTSVHDDRNSLVQKFIKLAISLSPDAILMENVPGLANATEFTMALMQLKRNRYFVDWAILDAANFQVPQHRKRLVLIASKMAPINLPTGGRSVKTVRQAISGLGVAGASGDPLHDLLPQHSDEVKKRIRSIPHDGGSRAQLPKHLVLNCHRNYRGFRDVYGRMRWDSPAPTITGGCGNPSKGRFLHPTEDRAITLREACILQGFPAGFVIPLLYGRHYAAQMIGNAFPPKFAEAHCREIAKAIS